MIKTFSTVHDVSQTRWPNLAAAAFGSHKPGHKNHYFQLKRVLDRCILTLDIYFIKMP